MMTKSKLFLSLLAAGAIVGTASAQSLKDAQSAIDAEQFDKAKSILQNLVTKKPKDGKNYFYLGQVYLLNDKLDSAAWAFNNGLTNAPKEVLNNVGLGIVDLKKNSASTAEQKFAQATASLGKKDYLPLYYIGKAYTEAPKPDYAKAVDYLTQAASKNTKDGNILVALGDAYLGLGENSQAYKSYRDALNLDPNLVKAKVQQALITRKAFAFDVALESYNAIAQEYPNYGPVYREIAETELAIAKRMPDNTDEEKAKYEAQVAKAVDAYKKYLQVTGDNSADAKIRYADFLVYGQQYEELKNVALELENVPGIDAKVYRYLGLIAINQDKDAAKAVGYFDKLFANADENRLIAIDYLFAGFANIEAGSKEKGLQYLGKALELDKELINEVDGYGRNAFNAQKFEAAAAIFNVPAQQKGEPWYYEANYLVGDATFRAANAKKEKGEDATADFQAAIKALDVIVQSTDSAAAEYIVPALYIRGYSNYNLDVIDPEKPELHQGLYLNDFNQLAKVLTDKQAAGNQLTEDEVLKLTDVYNVIGYYHILKEDYKKAAELFKKAIDLSPNDEVATQYLDALKDIL
ncbi:MULTISPECIES: tetratricopeptide repeat protein [Sphingobacterium]|uniref:Tetratricopeptide repeat protein n=1 Tax=Sphingobacterium thermophilum TaxID=768534 RepID=A0ABP8R7B8_9SPHI|nr:tetratricopeptide repeat protein [Sphingobacterium sp. T2]